jgi:hypothetical protein
MPPLPSTSTPVDLPARLEADITEWLENNPGPEALSNNPGPEALSLITWLEDRHWRFDQAYPPIAPRFSAPEA